MGCAVQTTRLADLRTRICSTKCRYAKSQLDRTNCDCWKRPCSMLTSDSSRFICSRACRYGTFLATRSCSWDREETKEREWACERDWVWTRWDQWQRLTKRLSCAESWSKVCILVSKHEKVHFLTWKPFDWAVKEAWTCWHGCETWKKSQTTACKYGSTPTRISAACTGSSSWRGREFWSGAVSTSDLKGIRSEDAWTWDSSMVLDNGRPLERSHDSTRTCYKTSRHGQALHLFLNSSEWIITKYCK